MKLRIYYRWGTPILVSASSIMNIFDQEDLSSRQNSNKPFEDSFHINWIHEGEFWLPSFRIRNGKTRIGNGRHRLKLLARHMELIPVDFDRFEDEKKESIALYESIVFRELAEDEVIEFPDLPIKDLGSDITGSPTWKEQ